MLPNQESTRPPAERNRSPGFASWPQGYRGDTCCTWVKFSHHSKPRSRALVGVQKGLLATSTSTCHGSWDKSQHAPASGSSCDKVGNTGTLPSSRGNAETERNGVQNKFSATQHSSNHPLLVCPLVLHTSLSVPALVRPIFPATPSNHLRETEEPMQVQHCLEHQPGHSARTDACQSSWAKGLDSLSPEPQAADMWTRRG